MVYGADLARAAAAKAGRVVLVEGYTDVIALRQAGVPEAVCSMGTALTPQQVDALARLAPKVLFCQDPDAAGQKAVGRGLEGLAEHNSDRRMGTKVDFRIVRLPAGQDPADVVQADGRGRDARAARRGRRRAALPGRARARAATSRAPTRATRRSASPRRRSRRSAPSVLRSELVKLVSDRLNVPATLVESVIADPARRRRAAQAAETAAAERRQRERAAAARRRRAGRPTTARRVGRRARRPRGPGPRGGLRGPNGAAQGRSTAASRPSAPSSPTASRCPPRASSGSREADLDELFSAPDDPPRRRVPPRPPAHPGRRPPAGRRAARPPRRRARHPRRPARGHPGQARARGPPARALPPRPPDRRRPRQRRGRACASSPPSARSCSTRSATA